MKRNYLIIIFLGFVTRIFMSITNFLLPYVGGATDSFKFHYCAGLSAGYEISSQYWRLYCPYFFDSTKIIEAFYVKNILSSVYLIFGHHVLIGNLFSCFVWLISAFLLVKILIKINIVSKYISYSLAFYSFVPSSIFYTSVILREPMQLLAINLSMFALIYFFYDRKIKYLILLLVSFFLITILHRALFFFILFLLLLFFIYLLIKSRLLGWIFLIPIIIVFYYIGAQLYVFFNFNDFFYDGFYKTVNSFRYHAAISAGQAGDVNYASRSQYVLGSPNIKNIYDFLIIFIPKSLFQYFLEPIPYIRVLAVKDFLFFFENLTRFILVIFCFKNIFSTPKNAMLIFFIMFLSYFFIETMWSVGTVNWGTASRHHVVSYGLLAIVAFYIPKKTPIFDKKIR